MSESSSAEPKRGKSSYKGVFVCGKKFKAQIQTNGVQNYLGLFDDEIEAAKAYDTHARMYLGNRAKTNFKYDTPAKAMVQPRPLLTIDDQIKQLRNKPIRNAKRVYAGIKVRSHSHNDLTNEPTITLSEPVRPHYNTIETGLPFDGDDEDGEVMTKDDLFICVSTDECDAAAEAILRKRRRSTGNITPKEISSGATEAQLADRTVNSSEVNTVVTDSSVSQQDTGQQQQEGGAFGSVFEDYETGLDIDWREQLWCLTESLSFDATISDQNKQPGVVGTAAASEIPATPLAAALAALQNVL